jgi:hypothetical protein
VHLLIAAPDTTGATIIRRRRLAYRSMRITTSLYGNSLSADDVMRVCSAVA